MVVHETKGWPALNKGADMFVTHFLGGDGVTTQLFISGDGTVMQGMELPRKTHHARPLNDSALGSETGHGWGNYRGNDHIGPYSSSDHTKVPVVDPDHPDPNDPLHCKHDENGKIVLKEGATYGTFQPLHRMDGTHGMPNNFWLPLSGNDAMAAATDDDLPGIKFWVRHQGFDEVVIGLWTTPEYSGPWREPQRVPEMLFTDAQYRAWSLLARWVAEAFLIPRNFALYPHKTRVGGSASGAAGHGMLSDADSFAAIVLADEGLSRSPTTFGLAAGTVPTQAQLTRRLPGCCSASRKRH